MTNLKIASETKCTVVVVGDSRTGKSALLTRFVHKTFQQVRQCLNSTLLYIGCPITHCKKSVKTKCQFRKWLGGKI
jgi:GTPase SAR1 family protein